ncbi:MULTISPECIES: hypothetical protein [Bacillus]|uniref:hypothetical protein n=1 Tax=Bacillus TaxID=1386 RepID=UPI000363AC6D|nr:MULTISPECIES: hypothetical protein [Bacillus]
MYDRLEYTTKFWGDEVKIAIIILLGLSILLFILSFFKKDRTTELERNIEELSLQHMQDMYQLKKKLQILEEELLIQDSTSFIPENPIKRGNKVNEILKSQVLALYNQGYSIDEISQRSSLSIEDITAILHSNQLRGI